MWTFSSNSTKKTRQIILFPKCRTIPSIIKNVTDALTFICNKRKINHRCCSECYLCILVIFTRWQRTSTVGKQGSLLLPPLPSVLNSQVYNLMKQQCKSSKTRTIRVYSANVPVSIFFFSFLPCQVHRDSQSVTGDERSRKSLTTDDIYLTPC